MRVALAVLIMCWPMLAQAVVTLPNAASKQVLADPTGYLDDFAVLITGFGKDGGIDRQGLDHLVGLTRAEARAAALRRLQGADLDGDGVIAADELAVAMAAAAAVPRGRLQVWFGHADSNGDGAVSAVELQAYANGVALDSFSTAKAGALYAVLAFDKDGDGRVTLDEARAGLAATTSAARKPAEVQKQLKIKRDDHGGHNGGQHDHPLGRNQGPHFSAI